MKHRDFIQHFINVKDESDEFCHIIWLPSCRFNDILRGECTDILAAYMDYTKGYELTFFIGSPDDRTQEFATLKEFPFSIQKKLISYIKNL